MARSAPDDRPPPTGGPRGPLHPTMALRTLSAGEGPYAGRLHAGDPPTVWVDADVLPSAVWGCAADGHVLAPLDLARVEGGHAAVLPHCPDRLIAVVDRDPGPGEVVTIAVSMLRAAQQAGAAGIHHGTWWVDATGRPVLAAGGAAAWRDEASEILERLAGSESASESASVPAPALRGPVGEAERVIAGPRPTAAEIARCEEELFAVAEPSPVRRIADGAVSVGGRRADSPRPAADTHRGADTRRAVETRREAATRTASGIAESWLARFTDPEWAGRVRDAARGAIRLRPRGERTAAPRRRVVLLAVVVAAGVLAGGLLWPSSAAPPDAAPSGPVEAVEAGTGRADAAEAADQGAPADRSPGAGAVGGGAEVPGIVDPGDGADASRAPGIPDGKDEADVTDGNNDTGPATGPPGDEDPRRIGESVLAQLTSCRAAGACTAMVETPGTEVTVRAVEAGAGDRADATLLDAYGGVAVFRVDAPGVPAQVLVLVKAHGKWLVRDVYDVADQP